MKLVRLRLCNFKCFGPDFVGIDLDDMNFLLGPNGAGKTAVLQALSRMFSIDPGQRKLRRADFYVPHDETSGNEPAERNLWIEAEFEFPELEDEELDEDCPAVPGGLAHMQLLTENGPAQVRFRLAASMDQEGEIEESFTYVIRQDDDGSPIEESRASKQDRNAIQVHYLPARRDPADHISYSANALVGRLLRSADWSSERDTVERLTGQISGALTGNTAIVAIADALSDQWGALHKGDHFKSPTVSFARSEIENLLRHMSVCFAPGHGEALVDFNRLSDGQQSLLYIALVLASHGIGVEALSDETQTTFDLAKLRPAVFTLIAVEEPENSLSPHYLGRVIQTFNAFSGGRDAQALVATHSSSLLRRVPPESIRYLRLGTDRTTVVKHIKLPKGEAAQKFVREGIQAFPELYFSRLVILGEGDSEEVVLPRLLAARGILADDASVSVVPLGGRHVNHFWRLLHDLGVPHVTLLDLDLARHQGGWGRISYAAKQLRRYSDVADIDIAEKEADDIPKWDSSDGLMIDDQGWISRLEKFGVFFSSPLDIDFAMIEAFPEAFEIGENELDEPDETTLKSVLGKNHDIVQDQYTDEQLELFDAYHRRFKIGSKPTWHIRALASLDDQGLVDDMPESLERMLDYVQAKLVDLPE